MTVNHALLQRARAVLLRAKRDRKPQRYDPGFYGKPEWRALRANHLRQHPNCAVCWKIGIRTIGVDVDHVVSRQSSPQRELDPSNLQTLCKLHHGSKTIAVDGQHRHKLQSQHRREYSDADGYPANSEWSAR